MGASQRHPRLTRADDPPTSTSSAGTGHTSRDVVGDLDTAPGEHLYVAEFSLKGKNDDPSMAGFAGTLNLYFDDQRVGSREIVTQPGVFCLVSLVGDGICVGRDSGSPVSPDDRPPFRFTGGTIDKVVVDVSGQPYIDHEAQGFMRD